MSETHQLYEEDLNQLHLLNSSTEYGAQAAVAHEYHEYQGI